MNLTSFLSRLRPNWQSASGQILRAAATVGAWLIISRLVQMARELVLAAQFGTGTELDALVLAFALVSFAGMLLGGAFGPAFIPEYVRAIQARDEPYADLLLRQATGWGLSRIVLITLLVAASVPAVPLLFPLADAQLLCTLAFVLLPLLPLTAMRQAIAAVLNARNRYALPTGAMAITPGVTIAVLLLQPPEWGVGGLAGGMVVGMLLEVLITSLALRRMHPHLWPRRLAGEPDSPIRRVIQQYRHLLVGTSLWATAPLVDSAMAAQLGDGAASTLRFSVNLTSAFIGLGAAALSIAVLPSFSRLVAGESPALLRRTTRNAVLMALTRLLYERGAFTAADTAAVSAAHRLCALQIPFYTVGVVLTRLLQSLQRNALVARIAVGNFFVNIGANLLFMHYLGVAGITLATSVVYALACTVLGVVAWRALNRSATTDTVRTDRVS